MKSESDLAVDLLSELQVQLGPKYRVTPAYASASIEGLSPNSRPDIVVSGSFNTPVLIEIRGIDSDQDLPISTAYVTKILREANSAIEPRIVILTKSKIGSLLKDELDSQGVKSFNATNFRRMVSELTQFIKGGEKKHQEA